MPKLRSATTTQGRNMAGAKALWRATAMTDKDFGKLSIAVSNSFTQFVPGHVHLKDMDQLVARSIEEAGGLAVLSGNIALDGCFSGGTSGLSIRHCSPEAAAGGAIALVENGDSIEIDIPKRTINLAICDQVLDDRRVAMNNSAKPWKRKDRVRKISLSLKNFALLATSADKRVVRDASNLED